MTRRIRNSAMPVIRRGAFLGCLVGMLGCTTPDSLMKLTTARGTGDEASASAKLTEYASDRSNKPELRAWALRALSRLKKQPLEHIERTGLLVASAGEDALVRSWAAYALGELRRKEAIPYFLDAMSGPVDRTSSYYVLEGLTKLVNVIIADTQINDRVLTGMNTYAAGQKEFPPDMFDLLNESITNLTVLTLVLQRLTKHNAPAPDPVEVYTAVYRTMSAIALKKSAYLASYQDNVKTISETFRLSFEALPKASPPIWLLVGWYAGVLADNREMSGLCAEELARWITKADPRERLLVSWSLSRMELHNEKAREALVSTWIRNETEPAVLRLLGALSSTEGQPDRLQELLKVQVNAEEGK